MPPCDKQHGFTLIEAIVALALFGTTSMALFGWLNANLHSLTRVEKALERDYATRAALEYIGTVNPLKRDEGTEAVGQYSISWQATPLEGTVLTLANPVHVPASHEVTLFNTEVGVRRQGGQLVAEFTLRQIGHQLTTEITADPQGE